MFRPHPSSVELKLPNDGAVRFSATERWRQDMARAANKLNGLVTDRVHQEERRWQEAAVAARAVVPPGFKDKIEYITICMPGSSIIHIETL